VGNFREEPDCRGGVKNDLKVPLLGGVRGGFLKTNYKNKELKWR